MKNMKMGTYFIGDESFNFNFYTVLNAVDKQSIVNAIVDTLVDGEHYNSILKDMMFDFILVRVMTDIDTKDFGVNDIEQFLEEAKVADVVKVNMEDGVLDELNKAVNLAIEYKTGIHPNPLGEALASLANTLEKKVGKFDLESAMGMVSQFAGMTEELTPESVVNAYINSDMHKKNLEEIAEAKMDGVEAVMRED